jgi:hypothetical protein
LLNTEAGSYEVRIDTAVLQPSPLAWPALTAPGTMLPSMPVLVHSAADVHPHALDHSGRTHA